MAHPTISQAKHRPEVMPKATPHAAPRWHASDAKSNPRSPRRGTGRDPQVTPESLRGKKNILIPLVCVFWCGALACERTAILIPLVCVFFLCGALACERTAQKKTNQNTQTAGTVSPEATPTLRESNPKSDRAVTHKPCRFIVTCRRGTDPWFTDPRSTGNVCVRVRVVCFGCGALTCERHANKKTFTDQGSADQGPVNRLI